MNIRIIFHRSSPPYEPGDEAGFPAAAARRLVDRGVASFADPRPAAGDLATMDRAALVRYAVEVLGFEGDPPPEVSDDDIRQALADALAVAEQREIGFGADETGTLDQLDALDRVHLEAFATTKAGFETVDPALTDDELRAQIRAKASAPVDAAAVTTPVAGGKGVKAK